MYWEPKVPIRKPFSKFHFGKKPLSNFDFKKTFFRINFMTVDKSTLQNIQSVLKL